MHFVMSTKIPLVLAMTLLLSQPEFRYDNRNSFTTFFCSSGVSRGSTPLTGDPPSCARAGEDSVNIAFSRVTLFCIQGATIEPESGFSDSQSSRGTSPWRAIHAHKDRCSPGWDRLARRC